MTMGSKSATATPARVASATKENFMVKNGFADLMPQRFIASVYSWNNWIQKIEGENQEIKRVNNGEMGGIRSKMGIHGFKSINSKINSVR